MSVVVAIRDEDKIWLAADSQVTSGWTKRLLLSQHSFKIWKNDMGINMGGVGSLRDLNILSTSDEKFIPEGDIFRNSINFKSMVRDTVPRIFKELDKFGRLVKEDGIVYSQSSFLIAHGQDCFIIQQDGAVLELGDMFAIGSGGDVAESAYIILRDTELTPKEKAIRTVMSSCERDLFVDYPIVITNTMTNEFEIFDGESFYKIDEKGEMVEFIPDEYKEPCTEECCQNEKTDPTERMSEEATPVQIEEVEKSVEQEKKEKRARQRRNTKRRDS